MMITRYKKKGYMCNVDILRQTAHIVVNPITLHIRCTVFHHDLHRLYCDKIFSAEPQ